MIKTLKRKFIKISMIAVSLLLVILLGVLNVTNLIIVRSQTGQTLSRLLSNEQDNPAVQESTSDDSAADENTSADSTAEDVSETLTAETDDTTSEDSSKADNTDSSAGTDIPAESNSDSENAVSSDRVPPSANNSNPPGENIGAAQSQAPDDNASSPDGTPPDQGSAPPDAPDSGFSVFQYLFSYNSERNTIQSSFFVVKLASDGTVSYTDTTHISYLTDDAAQEMAQSAASRGKVSGWTGDFRYLIDASDEESTVIFLDISREVSSALRLLLLSVVLGVICWLLMLLLVIRLSGRAIRPFEENMEKQRQFVTNAGHEIKTPLSIILANTDAMELYNGKNKWSGNIRTQVQRLSGLMKNLLLLARMDETSELNVAEDFSLSELTASHAAAFAEPMSMNHLDFQTNIQPDIQFHGNKEHLTQLVSILLDNALKYADSQGPVQLTLNRKDKRTVLSVSNTCSSLPDVPPERLFERFYRADKARTQKNGGYGIGLSVAQSIVQAAGGVLTAEYHEGNRITFTAKF